MIGIIGAMEEEVTILKNKLTQLSEISVAHVKFYTGILKYRSSDYPSGIGKL